MPLTIIGNYLSPFVRKVLVCLELKSIPYQLDPIIPFYGNEEFTRLNPDRRIPVLVDGDLVIPESSIICEYLEEHYPGIALLPTNPGLRAKARALQAFADQRMANVLIWRFFNQLVIRRFVWKDEPDQDMVDKVIHHEIPDILNYLETVLPANGFLFGEIGIADIAIAAMFRNAEFVQYRIDSRRWPRSAFLVEQALNHPSFVKLRPFEEIMLRTPVAQHREALRAAGVPVSDSTLGCDTPRRGPLSV